MSAPEASSSAELPQPVTVTALALAPAAIGCAVGVLIGNRLKRRNGEALAVTLVALAAAAALPLVVEATLRLINRPGSQHRVRGMQRGIRDAADYPFADELSGSEGEPQSRNTVSFPGL